jgi:GT2 family glycosyltransferase
MSVTLAYIHPGSVSHLFMESVTRTLGNDEARKHLSGTLPIRFRPAGICDARNWAVRAFLATDSEWLWFVDTDTGYLPDTLPRLMEVADPKHTPVVGAMCYGVREIGPDRFGGFHTRTFPAMYRLSSTFTEVTEFPQDTLMEVEGTGAACLLIHRTALEKVYNACGPVWFDAIFAGDGEPFGEDLSFCLRLRELRIPIHVHTGIPTRHQKTQWV